MKLTTFKATTLLTALCLTATLTVTSCGKKDAPEAGAPAAGGAPTTAPPAGSANAPAPAAGADKPLSAAEKAQLTPVKTALTMTNTAVKGGDMKKAKENFEKFSGLWTAVEPIVKSKAGASYPLIAGGIETFKSTMAGGGTPDKAKASEGLTAAIKAMDSVINKK
jgi:hypothetical protein